MRMRRIRNHPVMRKMVKETTLSVEDLIYPLFLMEGENKKEESKELANVYRYTLDRLDEELDEITALGIPAVLLFGIPDKKDSVGSQAYDPNGIIQRGIKKIKESHPHLLIITDVCMCEYTDHGHCGILDQHGDVDNDITLPYLANIALSHAKAGADVIAPSDMMDFRVKWIREKLDDNGYTHIPIMAYSAKFASSLYGPFRIAAHTCLSKGDRKGYQMDFHNGKEALQEVALDLEEDADFIMIKPATLYLDVIKDISTHFNTKIVAYHVSGEYAMLKNAIDHKLLDESAVYETMIAIKRAGAKCIITYFAKELATWLKEGKY